MELLEESAVIEEDKQFWFALNHDGKIRMRDEQALADMKHRAIQIVHPHDQLGRRFYFARDLLQNVAGFDDVFLFFGRRRARKKNVDIHFAQ